MLIVALSSSVDFHKSSVVAVDAILGTHDKPEERIDFQLEQRQNQYDMNKAASANIADSIFISVTNARHYVVIRRDHSSANRTSNKGNRHAVIAFLTKTDANLEGSRTLVLSMPRTLPKL